MPRLGGAEGGYRLEAGIRSFHIDRQITSSRMSAHKDHTLRSGVSGGGALLAQPFSLRNLSRSAF